MFDCLSDEDELVSEGVERHLGLPGHLVGAEVRARFAERPEVTFVGHDRRERIAFDFETLGWAESCR